MGFYQKMASDRQAKKAIAADGVQPTYKVLQVDMLKSTDRERAAAVASFVNTGEEAYKLAGHDGFAYRDLDLRGRCGVVCFRGVEVALLFRREVTERELGPAEPVPERVLSSPADMWMQIDLLNSEPVTKQKGLNDRLRQAMAQVDRLRLLWQAEEGQRKSLEEQLEKRVDEREELAVLRNKVAMLETRLKTTETELEDWRREASKQKEGRRDDRRDTVRELMPMFNTTWLAGQHRTGDQLYGIIRKQMTEALLKIGVSIIEPQSGDVFDHEQHHAVHAYQFDEGAPEIGTIVQVHRVGWRLGSLVVDAAEVAVGIEKRKEEGGVNGATVPGGAEENTRTDG